MRTHGPLTSARARAAALAAGALLVAGLLGACVPDPPPAPGVPAAVYDATPNPVPANLPSLGYEATSTREFGDHIALAGTARKLTSATVTFSTWALKSTPSNVAYCAGGPARCTATTWNQDVTVNIYEADTSGPVVAAGALLGTVTDVVKVPWRPEADPTCPTPTAYRADDDQCYNGKAFSATFDLSSLGIVAGNQVVVGIAYNTTHHGYAPYGGAGGPFDSLNVALSPAATTGIDPDPDAVFWNTTFGGFYADGGAAGVATFRQDTDWSGYVPAIQLKAID